MCGVTSLLGRQLSTHLRDLKIGWYEKKVEDEKRGKDEKRVGKGERVGDAKSVVTLLSLITSNRFGKGSIAQ